VKPEVLYEILRYVLSDDPTPSARRWRSQENIAHENGTDPAVHQRRGCGVAESLQAPTKIVDLAMEEDAYRRKGVAALIAIKGDIEGRVILDLFAEVAIKVASQLAGVEIEASEQVVRETVCELAEHGHRKIR